MEKFAIASTASKDVVKILIDDLETSQGALGEARDNINKCFEDLKKDRDALATGNGGIDVDGSEILDINAGGVVMSVTKDTLTQIKGNRLDLCSVVGRTDVFRGTTMVRCSWISILIVLG